MVHLIQGCQRLLLIRFRGTGTLAVFSPGGGLDGDEIVLRSAALASFASGCAARPSHATRDSHEHLRVRAFRLAVSIRSRAEWKTITAESAPRASVAGRGIAQNGDPESSEAAPAQRNSSSPSRLPRTVMRLSAETSMRTANL